MLSDVMIDDIPTYVTKLSAFHGRNASKPLKIVIITVDPSANQLPHGWKGAL
jgi:hypothetical protein